jgi:hypothetical protein
VRRRAQHLLSQPDVSVDAPDLTLKHAQVRREASVEATVSLEARDAADDQAASVAPVAL